MKNVHYILSPKPWNESLEDRTRSGNEGRDPLHQWWWTANEERLIREKNLNMNDGF